jgi:hypothetical protein
MFRHRSIILRYSTKSKDWRVGLVFLCFSSRLPEDGNLVPKHVGVETYHEFCLMIRILLDIKECISWLVYLTRLHLQ